MRTLAAVLLMAAACSSPPPVTWSLWQIDTIHGRGAGAPDEERTEREIERGLDRTACELVLDKKARAVRDLIAGLDASMSTTEGGASYVLGGKRMSSRFLCLTAGRRPPI